MTVIDYFLTDEDYDEYLLLSTEEIEAFFVAEPSRAKLFDIVYEAEFFDQQRDGSEMHKMFLAFIESHQHLTWEELYNSVGLYMDDVYREYLDRKYPGMMEAFISYCIQHESGYYWATAEYIGCALFLDDFNMVLESVRGE